MYRAVLDTCVLVPGRQRDFLLQLAVEDSYAPVWGSGILVELEYVLARIDARRGRDDHGERRRRLFEQMKHAFPGAEVNAPRDREYDYGLDDPDDGHVAHAAMLPLIRTRADLHRWSAANAHGGTRPVLRPVAGHASSP
ncbi:MAG: PIN domain-containing protein, partial [Actinomycetia bacterium]|nr:PIN domain-containing protein [Actinomycetes bacterium]